MRRDDDSGLVEPIAYARVTMVDRAAGRCVVAAGDIVTRPLPWLERRAGTTRSWSPPSPGEQGVLVCPGGDPAGAFFIPGVFSDAHPPIADDTRDAVEFPDGSTVEYDPDAHELIVTVADGAVRIVAPAGVYIEGDLDVKGRIVASEDILADTISLQDHRHAGVQPGGGQSGKPA